MKDFFLSCVVKYYYKGTKKPAFCKSNGLQVRILGNKKAEPFQVQFILFFSGNPYKRQCLFAYLLIVLLTSGAMGAYKENYPNRYKLKFYGKWIEIHQRSNSK
jgi:hypothetical protein